MSASRHFEKIGSGKRALLASSMVRLQRMVNPVKKDGIIYEPPGFSLKDLFATSAEEQNDLIGTTLIFQFGCILLYS